MKPKGSDQIEVRENLSTQGTLSTFEHLNGVGSDAYTSTEILSSDLKASATNNIGTVTGTITIGKTGLRASVIEINTVGAFKITGEDEKQLIEELAIESVRK